MTYLLFLLLFLQSFIERLLGYEDFSIFKIEVL